MLAPAFAADIRVATFNTELQRDGPGLLLRDILRGEAPDIGAAADLIARADADVIVLQGIDYDHDLHALRALRDTVPGAEVRFPHLFALRPNSGVPTGLDIDGDGRSGGPRDAQGYGEFAGQAGMAILSRWPISGWEDHSDFLWKDLPGSLIAADDPARDVQRLSSIGHWIVTIRPPDQAPFTVMTFHATPPVFDGPEDRNGRRNHDETAFWQHYLDGAFSETPPGARLVIAGVANADPFDGEARPAALRALLANPLLQDPRPSSREAAAAAREEGAANLSHRGDPALDTANWNDVRGPGNLRVDYVLPSMDWRVEGSGVLWPDRTLGDRDTPVSRHGLVWVDISGSTGF